MNEQKISRELSGGFIIAKTYGEFLAALSDQEAGYIMKGLVYEFWGCGEKPAELESPLLKALYNGILQTAREIDNNYREQLERRREAGRQGAKGRKRRSDAAPTEQGNAEQC